jgi:hypothetical protein
MRTTLSQSFDLGGDCLRFGNIPKATQEIIIKRVCEKFGQTITDSTWDRAGICRVDFAVGIPEEQADEALEFAESLATELDVIFCAPHEIGS